MYSVSSRALLPGQRLVVSVSRQYLGYGLPHGDLIPIEERPLTEVTHIRGLPIAPEGIRVRNPSFDVTPAKYISAIITEKGVVRGNYSRGLAAL